MNRPKPATLLFCFLLPWLVYLKRCQGKNPSAIDIYPWFPGQGLDQLDVVEVADFIKVLIGAGSMKAGMA